MLASGGLQGRTQPLVIIAPKSIKIWLENTLEQTQTHLPYEIQSQSVEELQHHQGGQFVIHPIPLSHRVSSFAYAFVNKQIDVKLNVESLQKFGIPKGPLWGNLQAGEDIQYEGKSFKSQDFVSVDERQFKIIVCGDNDTPELLKDISVGCHVLIHEATYTEDVIKGKAKDLGHSCAKQVAEFAESIGIPNLILTHFSARYQENPEQSPSIHDIHLEAANSYSGNLFLAKDFDRYLLDKSGNLKLIESESQTRV